MDYQLLSWGFGTESVMLGSISVKLLFSKDFIRLFRISEANKSSTFNPPLFPPIECSDSGQILFDPISFNMFILMYKSLFFLK